MYRSSLRFSQISPKTFVLDTNIIIIFKIEGLTVPAQTATTVIITIKLWCIEQTVVAVHLIAKIP